MLKFQNDYTTLFATFEDFILLVYTVIDDLYQQFAPACVSQRRNADSARMSDSEIITLSICGELLGMDSENAWYSFVKRNYRHLFPNLCCRTRFNRTRRALLQVTELLRQKLTQSFPIPVSRYFVIDSFLLRSANSDAHVIVVLSGRSVQIMEDVHPKRKPILALKCMPLLQ